MSSASLCIVYEVSEAKKHTGLEVHLKLSKGQFPRLSEWPR